MISISDITPSTKGMSMPGVSNKPISITPQKLLTLLLAVAIGVFLATSYIYEAQNNSDAVTPSNEKPTIAATAGSRRTSRGFILPRSPNSNKSFAVHETKVMMPGRGEHADDSTGVVQQQSPGGILSLGPVASEVGIVVALQACFPLISKAVVLAKQIRWASLGVRLSPTVGRFLKIFGKVWHTLMMGYKKTSASKIVSRAKKMVKIYKYHDDDDHHDDEHHDSGHDHSHHK